jgi:hypothetical protein
MSLYNILDEAIGFQKKLERDTHDRLMSKKEDVILESVTDYKTSFSTAKNLNCLNLENESSPTFERSKLAISFLIRVLSSDFWNPI